MNFTTLTKKVLTIVCTRLLPVLALLFITTVLFAQAPANDDVCTATPLTPEATCTYVPGTNVGATADQSGIIAPPACANFNEGVTQEVWYRATVPPGGAITFDMQRGTMTDGGMAVYRGTTCFALAPIDCDDNSSSDNMPKITVTGQTPGITIFVRVWSKNGIPGTFGICATIPAPAPRNDNPCGAIELPVGATCTYQTFTNASASNTGTVPAPVCAGYQGGDVWFKVIVPPATTALVFDSQTGTVLDGGMGIYKGSRCDSTLLLLNCDDNSSVNGDMPSLTVGGFTPGDTVWVRFWENGNDNNGTFGICVTLPPPPPANDDPCNATELPVTADCTYQTFSTVDATASLPTIPAPGCANYSGNDVWFKVVVPAEGGIIFDSREGVMTDGGMAIYNNNVSCDSLILLACDDNSSANGNMPKLTLGGLIPGDTLWVRFWEKGNDNNGTFGICASIPPPPPSNDDPCNAIELIPDFTCNYTTFTNQDATGSIGVPAPGCAQYVGGDVWFKVVVPAEAALSFDTQTGLMDDGGMALYRGDACSGNLTLLACDDNSSVNGNMPGFSFGGLTPGDTLWIRIWSNNNDNNGTFGLCVSIPPPVASNDEPCSAIELSPDITCNYQTFSTDNATTTLGVPAPGCANYAGSDVWFKVAVPAEGGLLFDTQTGVILDGGMALYTGTCDNLTLLRCDDDASPNGAMPFLSAFGLTPGDTVYVRFWEKGNDNNGTFGICVRFPPPPPANDEPCNAFPITADSVCNFQSFTNENATSSPDVPAPGCGNYQGGDVWFSVVVPSGGALNFEGNDDGVVVDGVMAIYRGSCYNLTLIDCDDDGSTSGLNPFISTGGLTPGDTIWIRYWEFGNDNNGTFSLCVRMPPPGPVNDDPCNAIELPVTAACNYQSFTNESAFGSTGVPVPSCANYQGGDVWFKAVVPADGAIVFDSEAGVLTDGGMAVYTGSCGNLTLVECDDNDGAGNMPRITVGGLTAGDTVWIRFWENGNNNNGTFGICATIPPPPPSNDNPCGAIGLIADSACNYQTFSNQGSFATATVPDPGCGNYQGSDVWFQVVAPAAGALNINTQAGTIIDGAMAIYSADSCNGTLTLIACDDNGSANPDMPYITATGLTPGSTIWIRVWSNGTTTNEGTFGICAVIPPLQPASFSFTCARDTSFNCNGGDSCFTLDAIIPDIHALTDRYAINPLSSSGGGCFNPYIDPGNEGPSTDLARDDIYTDVINLPFTFPFFGTNYNSLVASTNGYVSFDITNANQFSHWDMVDGTGPRNLPTPDGYYDRALIMGPYHDLNPFYNTSPTQRIKYNVTGTAPHRRWILSFYKVPLFDTPECDTLIQNTHQIVLYEGTGVVEVFIFDMQNCLSWNEGRAMVGMQDFDRTRGIMAPGRAATNAPWGRIGMNESWRFVPIGGPSLFKRVELFDTSGNFLATGDTSFLDSASLKVHFSNLCSLNRLPAGLNTLIVRAVYQKFDDPTREEIGADTIRVFIPNLRVNFDVTNGQCNSLGSVSVHTTSGVAPFRFSSDSGLTWQSDSVFANLAAGRYYFKVQDNAGCSRDTVIDISGPSAPLVASYTITGANCGTNGSVVISVISGGSPAFEYSADGGNNYQASDSFSLAGGTYAISIRDANGCTKDTTIIIPQSASIFGVYADSATLCNGSANGIISVVSVSGGTAPYTYAFDTNPYGTDSTLSTFAAGPHLVSIRDANGCIKDTTITVTEPAAIVASYTVHNASCSGSSNGSIVVSVTGGGTPAFEYSADGGNSYQSSDSFPLAAGIYTVRIRDSRGCTKDSSIEVMVPPAITAAYIVNPVTCFGTSSGSIIITAAGGTPGYEYSIDGGANYQADDSFAVAAGTFAVRIRDANGCTKDTSIQVLQPGAITATYTLNPVKCFATNSGSIIITAAGGTPAYTYSVDGGANYQAGDSFAVAAGTYAVRIRDANGCTKDSSIVVTQPQQLQATASAGSTGCNTAAPTGQITVTATGGTTAYSYSKDGLNFQPGNSFTGLADNNYTITVRDANGCTVTTAAVVGVVNDLTLQTRLDTTICGAVSVGLYTTTNAQTITWTGTNLSSTSVASPTASPTAIGIAEYTVVAQTGTCILRDTVRITVTAPPVVDAGTAISVTKGQDAQLIATVSNAANYAWSPTTYLNDPTSLSPMAIKPQETIRYTLTAFNAEGCSSSDTVSVIVTVMPDCIKVKNAFTPNGDGVNDNWMVYDQFDCLQNVRVQVFNRYGSRVFESRNYRNDWKGTYNGSSLPDATYYYVIDFTMLDGRIYQVRGDVTILR